MKNLTQKEILNYLGIGVLILICVGFLSSFALKITGNSEEAVLDSENAKDDISKVIQINILNACGEKGLAASFKKYMRQKGFDVLEIGNYHSNLKKTEIVDRLNDMKSAFKVAGVLGVNDSLVYSRIDSSLYLRTTIIIGEDFNTLNPYKM